jgi:hypothetical protein
MGATFRWQTTAKLFVVRASQAALIVGLVVLVLFSATHQSMAELDNSAAVRATSGISPGDDIDIQVDDTEWYRTVLLVDDDTTDDDPLTTRAPETRTLIQGLIAIGFPQTVSQVCAPAFSDTAINLWDTTSCGVSPVAADLAAADLVIWHTGDTDEFLAGPGSTLSAAEVGDLDTYLDAGGDLFLMSHNYLGDVNDETIGGCGTSTPTSVAACTAAPHAAFIDTYLGIDDYAFVDRTADSRPLSYDGVAGDPVGDSINWLNRRWGGYSEGFPPPLLDVTETSLSATGIAVLEENDTTFGDPVGAAPDNKIMTRTNAAGPGGSGRVVFGTQWLSNNLNRVDPDNGRTLIERAVRYLSDTPSVTVANTRTGESETVALSNTGTGVLTGGIATTSSTTAGPTGDLTINVAPGDQVTTTYSDVSPGPVTPVIANTTVVHATPLALTDSSGTTLTTLPVPGSVFVQVIDQDKNASSAVQTITPVTVSSSSGDSETVTLTETSGTSGIFRTTSGLALATGDTTANNGTLGVTDGATVSVTYAFLGAEVTKTFTQGSWHGGTTDSVPSIDTLGFTERDDQTEIDSDEIGYFVNSDPGNLTTDWLKNNIPPHNNPIMAGYDGLTPDAFDDGGTFGAAVVREPSTGDFYMWYSGQDVGTLTPEIGLAISEADTTSPLGRDFLKSPAPLAYAPVITLGPAGSWYDCGASDPTVATNPSIAYGSAGHFIMYFEGTNCGDTLSRIGRALSADGTTWVVDADPISETTAGAPLEAPFSGGAGDHNPSIIFDPTTFAATPYKLWFDDGASIFFSESATGATGGPPVVWTVAALALAPGAVTEWDDASTTAPTVAFDPDTSLFVMYYEGLDDGSCAVSFFPAIGRAEAPLVAGPAIGAFTKPAAPAEKAITCGAPATYENIVLAPPASFSTWEFSASDPLLLINPPDGIDRLFYNSPSESGAHIGIAWNIADNPDGTLHSNPIDTDTTGSTTVGFGPLSIERLGYATLDFSARTSDTLADLLFDPAPGLAYPAGAPFAQNHALLGDFSLVANGQRYIQYRAELAQDPAPDGLPVDPPPAGFVFSDAVESVALDVYQRPNLTASVSATADVTATDGTVRISDVTFTQDPLTQEVEYDLGTALDESKKIVIDVNGDEVLPGDQLDYRIEVVNSASTPLTNVTVSDYIPLGTDYIPGTIFGTGADDSGLPRLFWRLGTLAPGQVATIGFSVVVRTDIGQGSEILNQAFINTDQTGVVPSDNPVTPVRRDPTTIPVGAGLFVLLVLSATLSMGIVLARRRQKVARAFFAGFVAIALTSGVFALTDSTTRAQGTPANNVYFEVVDGDQNTDPTVVNTVTVTVTTTSGDLANVTLNETGVNTAIFRGSIPAVLDPVQIQNNSLLEVEPDDTISVEYLDQTTSGGGSATRSDSVEVIVDPLYTVSVIALTPVLLPGGGQQATIQASPRDVFGTPAANGTVVTFTPSVGSVSPRQDATSSGVAETTFTSSTITNPSQIDASVASGSGTDSGTLSLITNVSTTTTTTTIPSTLNTTSNVDVNNTASNNLPSSNEPNNTPPAISNQVSTPSQQEPPTALPQKSFLERFSDFFEQPSVNRTQYIVDRFVNPIATLLAIINLALATSVTLWYPFLLRIFLEPGQLFFGRRRRAWGTVYNSLTKQPIDLAIVRLYSAEYRLLATRITDRTGRYSFLVQPGSYRISVSKPNFIFPTVFFGGTKIDGDFKNLYHAQTFNVAQPEVVTYDIPLDPPENRIPPKKAVSRHLRRVAHALVSYSGLFIGLIALIIAQTKLASVLFILHIIVFALFRRLAKGPRAKKWGHVYDATNTVPLSHAVVRIFDVRYKKLLETQVADRAGRFGFLVGQSDYSLDALKEGYRFPASQKIKSSDYTGGAITPRQQTGLIVVDIPMEKGLAKPVAESSPLGSASRGEQTPQGPTIPTPPSLT